jgi:hypothetical protein
MAKQTIDIPDSAAEGKAVSDISKILAGLEDQASVERVAIALGVLFGFGVTT